MAKGHTEWPLDARSNRPEKLINWFDSLSLDNPRLVTSDLKRAEELAETIGESLGEKHETHKDLRELDYGKVSGHTLEEYREKNPEFDIRQYRKLSYEKSFPQGESPKEVNQRVIRTVNKLTEHDGDVVIVTHTTPILSIISEVYNQPQYNVDFDINTCDVLVLDSELSEVLSRVTFPEQRDIISPA